jgi:phospholipid transport system substrate-binding protein
MPMTPTRRILLLTAFASLAAAPAARAQTPDQASAFIDQTGKQLVAAINGGGSSDQQRSQLEEIIDRAVAVDSVARFCLGRYWRTTTPQQQQDYLSLFRRVLVNNLSSKLGEYKGVTFTLGRATQGEDGVTVATVITRPGQPPTNVSWLVAENGGVPKILDMIAEGTSLRITQRSDYAAFIQRNGENIDALLDALRKQASAPG